MHIGHAKAALLNDYIAHNHNLRPGCKLIIRFDDNSPSKEKQEFQAALLDDQRTLNVIPDKLISAGKPLVDGTALAKDNVARRSRLPSSKRDMNISETLSHFSDIHSGLPDDPSYHRTSTAGSIYLTYDFCALILDYIEGVALALRTNEYCDRDAQCAWFQEALGLRQVPIYDFSRLNFIVDSRIATGWDDPRMPTIRRIVRRGIGVDALKEVLNLQWGTLWALNKKMIDPTTPRHTAINSEGLMLCMVTGFDDTSSETKLKHVKNTRLGKKAEITLMNWENAYVQHIQKDAPSKVVSIRLDLNLTGDVRKTRKITWLASVPTKLVAFQLVTFDYLITEDKLSDKYCLDEFLAKNFETRTSCFADSNSRGLEQE
ncbi:Nucleotidylyl transferase [Clathrospora elynae]|uniref:Nucleotidylyl transferase n=1 Tax=Clathrospora elynae TaxID=706981 RepID=A0A6A5SVA1_9PLEO|nr:Nucleotidylyl transferase [Clathrospora elynae]